MTTSILNYLEYSSKKYPGKIAFSDTADLVAYQDLQNQAQAIGSCLAYRMGGKTNQPVAVFIDRHIASLISFMGIVYSGNFYVPIDGKMPDHRIEAILKTLNPSIILSQSKYASAARRLGYGEKTILFEDAINFPADAVCLSHMLSRAMDTDPLCVYFTSGSTGIPKGAILNHRSVIDMTEHFSNIFDFSEKCIFGNQAAFDFSVSLKDIYSTLKNGASLNIIPTEFFTFPSRGIQYINETKINTAIWTTSALRVIANLKGS